MEELNISLDMGSQLQSKNLGKHVRSVIEASADPCVERYTREKGVHNAIDMALLLRLLGDQTIQLTVTSKGEPVTSWVVKTTRGEVDHIRVIPGRTDLNTINFELELDDFHFDGGHDQNITDIIGIGARMLASNRGIRKQLNMMRLLMAGGLELAVGKLRSMDRNAGKNKPAYPEHHSVDPLMQ
jgi:hypothetical protein